MESTAEERPLSRWEEGFINPPRGAKRRSLWVRPEEREDAAILDAIRRFERWRVGDNAEGIAIPTRIHFIWFGGIDRLNDRQRHCIESWRRHHPDWEITVWTESEVEASFKEWKVSTKVFGECPNAGEKSDIARYQILFNLGGIYADVDVECLKGMPKSLLQGHDLIAGVANVSARFEIGNSLIACAPRNPFMMRMFEKCISRDAQLARLIETASPLVPNQTIARTGPGLFTKLWADQLVDVSSSSWLLLPPIYIYPIPNDGTHEDKTWKHHPSSFAVHWWHRSWQS